MAISLETKEDMALYITPEVNAGVSNEIAILTKVYQDDLDVLLLNVRKFVQENPGLTEAQIIAQLEDHKKNLSGVFGNLKKDLTDSFNAKTYRVEQDIFFGDVKDNTTINEAGVWVWVAVLSNSCRTCIRLHGMRKTMANWRATGGTPRNRDTLCKPRCKCVLQPTEIMPSRDEMLKPIQVAGTRIRKAEKKRGKKYSTGYYAQLLGSVNSSKKNVLNIDLRKVKKLKG